MGDRHIKEQQKELWTKVRKEPPIRAKERVKRTTKKTVCIKIRSDTEHMELRVGVWNRKPKVLWPPNIRIPRNFIENRQDKSENKKRVQEKFLNRKTRVSRHSVWKYPSKFHLKGTSEHPGESEFHGYSQHNALSTDMSSA